MLAFGEGKAGVVKKTVEGGISPSNPASSLQKHSNAHFYVDEAAATGLTRYLEIQLSRARASTG